MFEATEEKEKLLEKNSSSGTLKNVILKKYNRGGLDKFIKYKSFMEEYREFVISKPLHPLIKLRHLHNSVEGEALKLIKSYTLEYQLTAAIQALENAYSKPVLVAAEVYRNIKDLAAITSFNGKSMATAKEQVRNLKIAITTLISMGFEEELLNETNLQNTFLLVGLEAKVAVFVYIKWVDEKERIRCTGKIANIENFTEFYEKIVETQNDAVYIRNRLDELAGNKKEKVKSPKHYESICWPPR